MTPFQTFVYVEGLSTRMDKSVKIVLSTQELTGEAAASLFGIRNQECFCAFFPSEVKLSDIEVPKEEPEFPGQKSPSHRLRNVLYRVWEQQGKQGDFETWRTGEMERIIEHYKSKLEPF